jgi:hypothetical protein
MARLIVQPGSPAAWEIKLKAGANSFGRSPANDFKLDDPSVSGSHCQIVVDNGNAIIRDLGSTNGTFINRAPVKEAALQAGQTVHLGGLEMMFYPDAPGYTGIAQPAAAPRLAPGAPPLPPPRAVGPARAALPQPPASVEAPPVEALPSSGTGSGPCKHHPKLPGRHFCSQCQLFFCEVCVTTRAAKKFCRHCGAECVPVRVRLQGPAAPKGFFARFPSAFIYPFRGSGLLVLIVSTLVLAAMEYMGGSWFFILWKIAAYGYLFSFMQNIIHATANEEEQMPDLPAFDELFGSAFRFGVTVLVCFIVPITLTVLKSFDVMDVSASALIATMVLGCLYFPMTFLAVAMKDTALAANPLVVVPAIFKVPLGYLVTLVVVIGVFALRQFGDFAAYFAGATSYSTKSMSTLYEIFALRAVWCLVSVYLLTVSMRTLGLLYVTNKQKFGWFDH